MSGDCEEILKLIGDFDSIIENIFLYLNNYLLFAESTLKLRVCMEEIISFMTYQKYFPKLIHLQKLDVQLL